MPSLTGFLEWAQADDLEIKRQVDSTGDLIRVMTVHGAKGLEAPVVILPDCAQRAVRLRDELLPHAGLPVWRPRAEAQPACLDASVAAHKDRELNERLRLLYVAMTRAETWLIVAAAGELSKDRSDWYQRTEDALRALGAVEHRFAGGSGLRYETGTWSRPRVDDDMPGSAEMPSLEPYFRVPAPAWTGPVPPRAPSDLGGAKALPSGDGLPEDIAKLRGTYIHLLLERLAGRGPETWDDRSDAVPRPESLDAHLTDAARATALAVLRTPALDWIFAPETLAEVTLSARCDGVLLAGTVDRLIVTPEEVTVIDFKSNIVVPDRPEACPEGILRQMGAYMRMLEQIYPGRRISTGILWTTSGEYMALPQNLVTDAVARALLLDDAKAAS